MIRVASRAPQRPSLAALISFSISAGVRYSRARMSVLATRPGATCRFTLHGSTSLGAISLANPSLPMINLPDNAPSPVSRQARNGRQKHGHARRERDIGVTVRGPARAAVSGAKLSLPANGDDWMATKTRMPKPWRHGIRAGRAREGHKRAQPALNYASGVP